MKKGEVVLITCMIFLLVFVNFASIGYAKYEKISENVVNELKIKDRVNVIIEINDKKGEGFVSRFFDKNKSIDIEKAKDSVIDKIGDEKLEREFKKEIAMEITKKDLEDLENDESVKRVYYDYPVVALLQDSAVIINATTGWRIQISGENITGRGQAICIIDTGINYSHSDLGGCYGENNASSNCKVLGGWDFVNSDNNPLDDNGHGTHVAGIAAANGSINGIAPEAKLIIIKALNSGGSGSSANIKAGIDWCVDNSSIFNISVISMSLGTDCVLQPQYCYSSYCDSEDSLTSSINAAIAKNISVIVASGNNGNTSAISSPACIRNSTAIGASAKDETVASYSNRNSITDLFAPGGLSSNSQTQINSTCRTGGYCGNQGTSMATPHAAGAFALLREFNQIESGKILMTSEIESMFNLTGKRISDSGSGLNFSRIDVYSAILRMDSKYSNSSLMSPANNFVTINRNVSFSCNATDLQLQNITLLVYNSSGAVNYTNTSNISGEYNSSSWNVTLDYQNYLWNCYSCDRNNNCSYSGRNFSLIINLLGVELISPVNNTHTNIAGRNFSCNTTTQNGELTNMTFYIWNSSSLFYQENKTISGIFNETAFNFTFSYSDSYSWNCRAFNNNSFNSSGQANFSFVYDNSSPALNVSLINNSWHNGINLNLSSNESLDNCWISFNNENISMNKSGQTFFYYLNSSINESIYEYEYNLTVYCNDSSGNVNESARLFFGVDLTSPVVNSLSPGEGDTSTSSSVNFQFNASDSNGIAECRLVITGTSSSSTGNSSAINNLTNTITKSLDSGSYSWKINCSDSAGNYGSSSARSLTVNLPAGNNNAGGGGGGSVSVPKNKTMTGNNTIMNQTVARNDTIEESSDRDGAEEIELPTNRNKYIKLRIVLIVVVLGIFVLFVLIEKNIIKVIRLKNAKKTRKKSKANNER
ncbi:S8 family serine peptidase [Candidatus Pacearchaeota archaeon]|nr:S8 family serine peptidase [Candidatus Pacearchaeota archaeon]